MSAPQPQCEATLLQKDDRWGGFVLRCERGAGHIGEQHEHTMNGCDPVARLVWVGSYDPASLAGLRGSND